MISFNDLVKIYAEKAQSLFSKAQSLFSHGEADEPISGERIKIDRDHLRQTAMQPHEWHNAVLKLVASYVSKKTDEEIHILTQPLTCTEYSLEHTRHEVQVMIDSARLKGFDGRDSSKANSHSKELGDALPLIHDYPPPQKYPIEALGPLQKIVETVQKASQAPIEIAAASALSATSLIVQGHANVDTLGGEKPLSLYMLTIARSGERKSSCDALIIAAIKNF